ncbi:hypothetical protein GRI58_14365 [Porphyrobacter algicida]|uniref:Uncharacterized protein n=1 Tax=Qipengyuania algicida TaxID=1836209 RepID=A0A845AM86_9SPHN|nr:hypothetical protein [Qipengyuania algicida]MXP29991.1 hypothetical protein [Qipengyuania algicida]
MSMWTAIVIIVAVVAISRVMRERRLAHRDYRDDYRQDSADFETRAHDASLEREIEDLRERIKVLERIATDGNSLDARETRRISEEIEALRKKQDN